MENKSMHKTSLCDFWKQNKCINMNSPGLCKYAHGEDELKVIECKYKNYCFTSNCSFSHKPITRDITINLLDCIKYKNKIKKNKINNKIHNIKNMDHKNKEGDNNNNIIVSINKKECKCDINTNEYYKLLLKKNEELLKKNTDFIDRENQLKLEIDNLNKIIKEKEIKLENINRNISSDKIDLIDKLKNNTITKYYNIGKIIIEQNKTDIEHIRKYFKCKNISMIKNRSVRMFKVIEHMKKNNIENIKTSLRNIFHMNNCNFLTSLINNTFFQ